MKAEELLRACPKCGEWPMVANERKALFSRKRAIQFLCIHCGYREKNPPSTEGQKMKTRRGKPRVSSTMRRGVSYEARDGPDPNFCWLTLFIHRELIRV